MTSRRLHATAIAACAAAVLVAAGCSGSGTTADPAPTAPAVDADAYRAAADATCAENARAVRAIDRRLAPATWGAGVTSHDRARAEAAIRQTLRIRAVVPPPELEELHFSLIRGHADYADAYARAAQLSAAGDRAGWRSSNAQRDAFAAGLRVTASSIGLRACARVLPHPGIAVPRPGSRPPPGAGDPPRASNA